MNAKEYVGQVIEDLEKNNPGESEFLQLLMKF